jgi:hypothetical protein
LYLQIPGLYGDKGIVPVHRLMMKGTYTLMELSSLYCTCTFLMLNI